MEDWVKHNWGFILFVIVMAIIMVTPHLMVTCPHYEQPRVIIEVQTKYIELPPKTVYVEVYKYPHNFDDFQCLPCQHTRIKKGYCKNCLRKIVCPCGSYVRIDLCHGKQVLEYIIE